MGEVSCRVFAKACGAAIIADYISPREGLSSISRELEGLPGIGFLSSASTAVLSCLKACKRCFLLGRTGSSCRLGRLWRKSCREALVYGNTSAGTLMLLVFQAGALGHSLALGKKDDIVSLMGSVREVVEREGREASKEFYRVYRWLSPRYLARISYEGLPDIFSDFYLEGLPDFSALACSAGLYDNVFRDLCRGFEISLGYAYSLLRERIDRGEQLRESIRYATSALFEEYGDFLAKRKESGPRSTADIVNNALARIFYEAFSSNTFILL